MKRNALLQAEERAVRAAAMLGGVYSPATETWLKDGVHSSWRFKDHWMMGGQDVTAIVQRMLKRQLVRTGETLVALIDDVMTTVIQLEVRPSDVPIKRKRTKPGAGRR